MFLSLLNCKEIQSVHPKGDQSWAFIGRTDAKAETPILWPPHAKSWLIGKDSDAGRDWWQEEKGTIEDEMAGWHHQIDAHEFGWTLGVCDGQGALACCDSWGRKELDKTDRLHWTDAIVTLHHWTLLLPAETSTTECLFHFGPATSFFLELLVVALHSSPVPQIRSTGSFWPGGSSSGGVSFYLFILFVRFLQQEYRSGLPFSSPVDYILSDFSLWPVQLGWLCMA